MTFWGADVFAIALLFARVAAMTMLLPGFGESTVPARIKLAFALALSVLLAPLLAPKLPMAPASAWAAGGAVLSELFIGLMLGSVARMLMAALSTAGQILGLETGLAFAQTNDPTMGQGGQLISVFLGVFGVALIFATDLHHQFLRAIVGSYDLFTPARLPDLGDTAQFSIRAAGDSFRIAVQIAAPLMLAGFVFRLGLGILSRLIPQIQVFFIAMPINLLGGFIILAFGLSAGMLLWLDRLQNFATTLR